MPGYFTVVLAARVSGEAVRPASGPDNSTLTVESKNGYKGNIRIDFVVNGVSNPTVTPSFSYAFLDEDEVQQSNVAVAGSLSAPPTPGTLQAVGYDGTTTVNSNIVNVSPSL